MADAAAEHEPPKPDFSALPQSYELPNERLTFKLVEWLESYGATGDDDEPAAEYFAANDRGLKVSVWRLSPDRFQAYAHVTLDGEFAGEEYDACADAATLDQAVVAAMDVLAAGKDERTEKPALRSGDFTYSYKDTLRIRRLCFDLRRGGVMPLAEND